MEFILYALLMIAILLLTYCYIRGESYDGQFIQFLGFDSSLADDPEYLVTTVRTFVTDHEALSAELRRYLVRQKLGVAKPEMYYLNVQQDKENVHDPDIFDSILTKWKRINKIVASSRRIKEKIPSVKHIIDSYDSPNTKHIIEMIINSCGTQTIRKLKATVSGVLLGVWRAMHILDPSLKRDYELALESCATNNMFTSVVCPVGIVSRIIDVFTHTTGDEILSAPIVDPTAIKNEAFLKSYAILQDHLTSNKELGTLYDKIDRTPTEDAAVHDFSLEIANDMAKKIYDSYVDYLGDDDAKNIVHKCIMGISDSPTWVDTCTEISAEVAYSK